MHRAVMRQENVIYKVMFFRCDNFVFLVTTQSIIQCNGARHITSVTVSHLSK